MEALLLHSLLRVTRLTCVAAIEKRGVVFVRNKVTGETTRALVDLIDKRPVLVSY